MSYKKQDGFRSRTYGTRFSLYDGRVFLKRSLSPRQRTTAPSTLPLPTTRATKKRIGHNHHHYRHEALRSKKHRTLERGGGRGRSRLPQFLLAATTWRQGRHAIAPRSLYRVHPGWCLMTVAIDQRSGEAFGLFARAETSKRSGVC